LSAEDYSANITLTATDGIDQTFGTVTLNVGYLSELWDETVLSIGTSSTDGLDNSTFIDRSTNAHTVTPTGTPVQTAFHPYLDNWSVEFDGGDSLTAPTSTDFAFDADFTVEAWCYLKSTSASAHICDFRLSSSSNNNNIAIAFSSSTGTFVISIADINAVIGTTSVSTNQWYHVVACRNSGVITLYVNGVGEDSVSDNTSFTNYTNRPILGAFGTGTTNLNGFISNFRVIKGTALYTSNFTPSTTPLTDVSGTSLLTCQSNRFIDNSTNAHTITVSGDPKVSAFNPFGQESEYAAGENKGSYFSETSDAKIDTGLKVPYNTSWTAEMWLYMTAKNNNEIAIISQYAASPTTYRFVFNISPDNKFRLFIGNNSGSTNVDVVGTGINFNEWTHLVYVHTANTGSNIYINGIRDNSLSTNYNGIYQGENFWIGDFNLSGDTSWDGYISDFRYTEGTAVYTTDFTPPTAPVGNSNASLYLPMDNAGIFDKTGNHTLTPVGNASTSTTQTKYADTAIYFDGTGDYISIDAEDVPSLNLFGDFTVEFWIYRTGGSSTYTPIFGIQPDNGQAGLRIAFQTPGMTFRLINGDNSFYVNMSSSSIPTLNGWTHIALTRSGNTCYAFIDGVLGDSEASTPDEWLSGTGMKVFVAGGRNASSGALGTIPCYIEGVQILKGVAKYTANFTPPNRTQGITYQAES
jgi:hypothetical protein